MFLWHRLLFSFFVFILIISSLNTPRACWNRNQWPTQRYWWPTQWWPPPDCPRAQLPPPPPSSRRPPPATSNPVNRSSRVFLPRQEAGPNCSTPAFRPRPRPVGPQPPPPRPPQPISVSSSSSRSAIARAGWMRQWWEEPAATALSNPRLTAVISTAALPHHLAASPQIGRSSRRHWYQVNR